MISFTTHDFIFFTRKEIWFYNGENVEAVTYNVFSAAEVVRKSHTRFSEKYTTTYIDLSKTEDELFEAIHKTYKYDIRAAAKRGLEHKPIVEVTNMDCLNLLNSFRDMAKSKGITFLNKRWLSAVRQSGNIYITKMMLNNIDIVTHVYIFDKQRILLTNSFHNPDYPDVRLRSEANKLLHWKDILFFKNMNFSCYDFGGINPQSLPGISQFKLNFGGETKEIYRFIQTSDFVYLVFRILKKASTILSFFRRKNH